MFRLIPRSLLNSGLLLLAAVPLFTFNVQAQDAEAEESVLEEVIVTGTHIAGINEEALPVTVMSAEAIESTGAINMGEVLSFIPAISDLEFEDNSNGTNSARGDVAGISMRGLPSANTLTLINGRRMVVWPTFQAISSVPSTFYNVNSVPSSAVQRVEVLRDGAAPLYGADAIAGVVNFITYSSFDDIRITGRYGWGEDTNYDESEITAAGGWNFNEGRSNFSVFATWYKRSHVRMDELDELYFDLDRRQNERIPESWRGDSQLRNLSTRTPYARISVGELLDDGQFVGDTWHVDPDSGELEQGNPSLRYNFNEPAWVTPEVERFNIMATFRHEFGESMEFFADAFYYESESLTQRAASPIDEGLAYLIMPADSYYNPFDEDALIVRWRPVDLGPRIIQADGETWSITAGLRGDWSNWSWEAGLVFSEAKATDIEQNRQSKTLFTQQLAVDGPDALNPLALPGENTQAALDGIRVATTDVRKSELTLADFRLNRGDLFQTFGNDTGIALGVEWREETYKDDRDQRLDGTITYTTGPVFDESDVIGMSATPDSGASRDTYSAYGELYMPLIGAANEKSWTRGLELQLAVRYENPSDFDDKWAPKIGFRWEIVEGLSIRGSYTEGFKAPNLPQMNQGDIVRRLQDIEDPMRADVTDAPIDTGDTYRITSRLSNPNLDPEESETTLIGFVFTPTWAANEWWSGLRIGADWWNIKQTGLVGIIDEDDQLAIDQALRESGAGFNPNVVRAEITPEDQALFDEYNAANPDDQRIPVGVVTNIISQYENLQPREVEGWDATFVYATPETAAGQFTLRADYTRITKFDQEGLVPVDRLRRNGNPENRYTVSLDWRFRNFFANVNARYVDEAYDTSLSCNSSAACQDPGEPGTVVDGTKYWTVEDWTVYNLTLGYDFAGMGNWSNGLILNGGIRNLTNEEPPFADESYGYLTRLHNTYGRVYWFRIGYQF